MRSLDLLFGLLTFPGVIFMRTMWGGLLMAFGTWIAGDHSPYPQVAVGATIVGFVVTYILTVFIELKYLKRVFQKEGIHVGDIVLKHCIYLNILSYLGLVTLFFVCEKHF